jgi:hypothetical protein
MKSASTLDIDHSFSKGLRRNRASENADTSKRWHALDESDLLPEFGCLYGSALPSRATAYYDEIKFLAL